MSKYKYVIVGGGLAGDSAIEGIREHNKDGSILMIAAEKERPYHRPPLSKKLILGKKKLEEIYTRDEGFYEKSGVELKLGSRANEIDPPAKTIKTEEGKTYGYEKLLLATGGFPRKLALPGIENIDPVYFRYKNDYLKLAPFIEKGKSALIIGGGFIGAELASALNQKGMEISIIFPGTFLLEKIFPRDLAKALQDKYIKSGVKVLFRDAAAHFDKVGSQISTTTTSGKEIKFDVLIIGIGIESYTHLANEAGLKVSDGIEVNEMLQTSDPNIYSAGDATLFPYKALEEKKRIEHWDNSYIQGKHAGRNMAGYGKPYEYMPYFFSDLFDFGFEAVGEINSSMDIYCDWKEENKTGIVYYSSSDKIRGVMLCNVWEKVDEARKLILDKAKSGKKHIKF